ncbi:unnamed protein product [Acanthoscelides obtectus]|uniref:PIN domain-containing protein n=1 Tax=Acanthoscelides obtectus TaxID=200917 RepID=A0A9P0KWA2_ACAOB|nr:unnamed protein product [Acanthoscelides obtectus]CAK1635073.1 Transcriptional protein SWT1 [Acanthoscelides obtectus]
MSFREDREELQAQRLRICPSNTTTSSCDSNEYHPANQGIRRNYSYDSFFGQDKDFGYSNKVPQSTQITKNLANNRLQRLKHSLKLDVVQDTNQYENKKKCQLFVEPSNIPTSTKAQEKITSNAVERKSTNIYKNLAEWSTAESPKEKNTANNRLKRLKKCILNNPHENNSMPTSDMTSPKDIQTLETGSQISPLLKHRGSPVKRRASDRSDDQVTSQPPLKKSFPDTQDFPSRNTKDLTKDVRDVRNISVEVYNPDNQNTPSGVNQSVPKRLVKYRDTVNNNITKLSTVGSNNSNVDNVKNPGNSTYLSHTLRRNSTNSLVDKTYEKGHSMMSPPIFIPKSPANSTNISSPMSHRNSISKQENSKVNIITNIVVNKPPDTTENPTKLVTSVYKPFTPSPKHDSFIQNTLMTDQNIDSYHGKMALTASWVEYHTNPNIQKEPALPPNDTIGRVEEKPTEPVEEMEWANAEPDEEIAPVEPVSIKDKPPKLKDICIVVDTNIFISHLSKLKEIVSMKVKGNIRPIVHIPWMVIQELDYMKDTCSKDKLKRNIVNSVHFINKGLQEKDPRIIGQTVREVERQKHIGSSPDDKIISCCMQVSEKYDTVILLSNDMNLKNKALINSITACSIQEIESKISDILANNKRVRFIMQKMGILCSSVICECARDAYGTVWKKMSMLNDAPWSFTECLKRIKKYWKPVFQERILKHCIKTCDDLYKFIKCNKNMSDDSNEFLKFTEMCIALCVFFKDIEEYRESVQKTLDDIKNLE